MTPTETRIGLRISGEVKAFQRVPLGVEGLDEIIGGGIPAGDILLVSGMPGSGRTTLAFQFLYYGCTKYGDPGIFVAVDEKPDSVRSRMSHFGWNVASLERKGALIFADAYARVAKVPSIEEREVAVDDVVAFLTDLFAYVEEIAAHRVVIDSVSTLLAIWGSNEGERRSAASQLCASLRETGLTTLMTAEALPGRISRFGIEEYVADDVIVLHSVKSADGLSTRRMMEIVKLKGYAHPLTMVPYRIEHGRGIVVVPPRAAREELLRERIERIRRRIRGF